MSISLKTKTYLLLIVILAIGLLCACANPAPPTTPPPDNPSESPNVPQVPNEPSNAPDRVDVVYCHRPQRCVTCLCFEERIIYVVNTYFQRELKSGKLTLRISEEQNRKKS